MRLRPVTLMPLPILLLMARTSTRGPRYITGLRSKTQCWISGVQAARTLLERGAEGCFFYKLIASIQSEMDGAPLAPQARRDEWLNTISVLREFKEERRAH